ncbi:hypothetical protein HJC23_003624 [Cyclotella cryptica]|uniref:NADP-dependent oxidoreductase domain-containing protein n=1 Tax=Cyclotella cryptica TaxID=29204 RepID=A0ABD3QIN4_9STRA
MRRNHRRRESKRWMPYRATSVLHASLLICKNRTVVCWNASPCHQSLSRHVLGASKASSSGTESFSISDPSNELRIEKSPESTFWNTIPQKYSDLPSSIPAVHRIDEETGPLPPGAYRSIGGEDDVDAARVCLISAGIYPPEKTNSGYDIWTVGVKNCQKLMDSGFNSFSVRGKCGNFSSNNSEGRRKNSNRRSTKSPISTEPADRHESESQFYHRLRQNTPLSILRSCHFTVKMEMPSVLSVPDPILDKNKPVPSVPFGNGWMVRKSISDALLRVKTECLDNVQLKYQHNSPYHLDVLNSLHEMRLEGLIKSISTRDFPASVLQSAFECGFDIYANEADGSLLNSNNLQSREDEVSPRYKTGSKLLVSAPLAGALLTDIFSEKEDWRQLTVSQRKLFDACCKRPGKSIEEKWENYRAVMDTLADISIKHNVSIESVALRWLLQLNSNNMISVGTKLGMDLAEENGGPPHRRDRDFRQVFTFSLEDEDVDRLCEVSDISNDAGFEKSLHEKERGQTIDFHDKSLWL